MTPRMTPETLCDHFRRLHPAIAAEADATTYHEHVFVDAEQATPRVVLDPAILRDTLAAAIHGGWTILSTWTRREDGGDVLGGLHLRRPAGGGR